MSARCIVVLACAIVALAAAPCEAQDAGVAAPMAGDAAVTVRRPRFRRDAGVPREVEPARIDLDAGVEIADGGVALELPDGAVDHADLDHVPGEHVALEPSALEHGDAGADALEEAPIVERDAGMPSAGEPRGADTELPSAPPEPVQPERDFLGALSEWMWERAERESVQRDAVARESVVREPAQPTVESAPRDDVRVVIDDSLRDWIGFALPDRRMSTFGLVVLLAFAALLLFVIAHLRRPLPERGALPRVLGLAHLIMRLATLVMLLMLLSRLLPAWLQPSLLLTIAAVAVAVGFGAVWTLLPDVVGSVVLLTEGRLRPGQWIAGEGFAGTVEQIGPRATVLRAPNGALLTVPNRRLVKSPVHASDRLWHEVEVELRAPLGAPAAVLRQAIRDAVLSSPYIPPDPGLTLSRDPREPERWRLKVRLLNVRFTALFEGQLLERVEEALERASAPRDPDD